VDGKTLRGSRTGDGAVHLLAATCHNPQIVVAQRQVEAESNEIPAFTPLLSRLDLTGVVVTADALHTQHDHARHVIAAGGHYLFIVKGNQPTLLRRLKALPWREAVLNDAPTSKGTAAARSAARPGPPDRLNQHRRRHRPLPQPPSRRSSATRFHRMRTIGPGRIAGTDSAEVGDKLVGIDGSDLWEPRSLVDRVDRVRRGLHPVDPVR
jgi:hypothetical protein